MKPDILKFLKKARIFYMIFSIIGIVLTFFCLLYATRGYIGFILLSVIMVIFCIFMRVVYNIKIAMGVVYEIQIQNTTTLVICTKKEKFSYDLNDSCKDVVVKPNKFICTFSSGGEKDVFTFYKYAPFSRNKDVQFSLEEIRLFYPDLQISKTRG